MFCDLFLISVACIYLSHESFKVMALDMERKSKGYVCLAFHSHTVCSQRNISILILVFVSDCHQSHCFFYFEL